MKFDRQFEKMQHQYKRLLEWCLENAAITLLLFALLVVVSLPMSLFIGKDFFPYVDSGQMKLHVNPPQGLRLEDSEQYFAAIEREIRSQIPADRVELLLDNIGLPNSGINLAFGGSSTISNSDGDILIALKPGKKDTQLYTRKLRDDLRQKFPDATFFFTPANITNRSDSRGRRCASAPTGGVPDDAVERGPHEGPADRADAAGCGAVDADLAHRVRADGTELLAESADGRELCDRDTDAELPDRQPAGTRTDPGDDAQWECVATAWQPGDVPARPLADHRGPLQHSAGLRRLRGCG
jgi:hypothetical protein